LSPLFYNSFIILSVFLQVYKILFIYANFFNKASCKMRDKLNPASIAFSSIHFGMLTVRFTAPVSL